MSNSAPVPHLHAPDDLDGPAVDAAASARLRPRGSNQMGMRQFNERVVLQALRVHGSRPKAELARLTGLTARINTAGAVEFVYAGGAVAAECLAIVHSEMKNAQA